MGDFVMQGLLPVTSSLPIPSLPDSFKNSISIAVGRVETVHTSLSGQITRVALQNTSSSANGNDGITSWSSGLFKDVYMSEARSCWSNYSSYWMTYASPCVNTKGLCQTVPPTISDEYTEIYVTTIYPSLNVSTYTLCDGYPRADYPVITTSFTTTLAWDGDGDYLQQNGQPMPPVCLPTNGAGVCGIINFGSNIRSLANISEQLAEEQSVEGISDLYRIVQSMCGSDNLENAPCLIQGGPARLIYFPVTTESGDVCNSTKQTITTRNLSSVVSTLGTQFTSGTAYISFGTLYAGFQPATIDKAGELQIGRTFSDVIFSFKSNEISTVCYDTSGAFGVATAAFGGGEQLNFADLNSPIPASAYQCQNDCRTLASSICHVSTSKAIFTSNNTTFTNAIEDCVYITESHASDFCSTIWDNFNPLLAMPTMLRDLVPEWSTW